MSSESDWWRTFFSGMAVDFWLQAASEDQTRQEADFIQSRLRLQPPAAVLDVPCGGGRHSLALAARGFHVTGVDLSTGFMETAQANSARSATDVRWVQKDMHDLSWQAEFDGAFCFGNSFGYADDAGNAKFLSAVARALKPGGRFVLDTSYLTEGLLPALQERGWYQLGDVLTLSERRYDPIEGRLHVDYIWVRDGRTEKRSMSARLYTYREIAGLLQSAGFTDVEGVSSLSGEPFKFRSSRLLMSATKR